MYKQQHYRMMSPPPDSEQNIQQKRYDRLDNNDNYERFDRRDNKVYYERLDRRDNKDYYERYDRHENNDRYDQRDNYENRYRSEQSLKNTNIQSINYNLPKRISLDALVLLQIEGMDELRKLLTDILNKCDENDINRRLLAPAIAVCVDYVLLEKNYYLINSNNPKRKYKINYRVGKIDYEVAFIKGIDEKSTEKREIKISGYDISDLPKLSEVLVTGILLDSYSIKNRLSAMKRKKQSLEFTEYAFEANTDKLIKCVIKDLFQIQKFTSVDLGWPNLIRYFLLGLIMMIRYDSKTKAKTKVQDRDDKKLFNALVNSREIKEILISVIKENYENESELTEADDYIAVNNRDDIRKEMVNELKIASLLYFFVKYFGILALISFRIPDIKHLNQMLSFKNIDEMGEHFLELSQSKVGVDFIKANEKNANKVIESIAEFANIYYSLSIEDVKNSLMEINNKNDFKTFCNKDHNTAKDDTTVNNSLSQLINNTQQKYEQKYHDHLEGQLQKINEDKENGIINYAVTSKTNFRWQSYEFEFYNGVYGTTNVKELINDNRIFSESLNANVVKVQKKKAGANINELIADKYSKYSNEEKLQISLYYLFRDFCDKHNYEQIYTKEQVEMLTAQNNEFLASLNDTKKNEFLKFYNDLFNAYNGNKNHYIYYLDNKHKEAHIFHEAMDKYLNQHKPYQLQSDTTMDTS